ncbi:Ig-like domain-containing protein, partial [Vibrio fluvialis]|nr:Ig-like domain-containing protein [Vibrio fluvialis]
MSSGILSANQMIVIDTNGNIRTATIGEKLPHGTVIVQRGDNITDDAELKAQLVDANNTPQDITDDVARIFAALEEGQDPTQIDDAEAPAAGGAQGSALAEAATIERIGSETIATTDFDTTGFESLGLSQTQSLTLSNLLVVSTGAEEGVTIGTPAISFESTGNDDIYNAQEVGLDGTITATISVADSKVGDTLTYTVNGIETSITITSDNIKNGVSFEVEPGSTLSAILSDEAGNQSTLVKGTAAAADTEISKPTIDLVALSDSGDSDTDNLTNDKTPTFALGNIDSDVAAEDIVVLKDGVALDGTLENVNGTWQFTPSADLADGTYVLSVKVTDDAGNSATSETLAVTIDTVAAATITVDAIAGDDIVNAQEAQGTVTITGTVGGDANVDDTVTLTVNGKEYTGKVFADAEGKLVYSIDVQGSDLVADADSTIVARVSGTDEAGNAFTATSEASGDHKDGGYEVDTEISKPTIDLVALSDSGDSDTDNLTNDKTPTFELGNIDNDVVTVEVFNGETKLGNATQAQDGTWQFTPSADLADGTYVLSVKVTDKAGNHATSETLAVTIDGVASASITVDVIAGDDIVNAQDAQGTVTITGTVGGDATEGDTVTLTLQAEGQDATTYIGTVKADGTYSINVPGGALATDADRTIVASVSGTDAAGNAFTATTEVSGDNKDGGYKVDTEISKPTIDLLASSDSGKDDTLGSDTDNLTNDKTPTFALGNIDADADKVEVYNGTTLLGEATQVDGVWTFTAAEGDLSEGANALTVKVTDKAGNHATSETLAVTIDGVASASITVDVIAGDD